MSPTPVYDTLAAIWHVVTPAALHPGPNSPYLTWQEGVTPLSTFPIVALSTAAYLTTILGGRELMNRFKIPPMQVKEAFVVHNIFLSFGSLCLLLCMLEEILPIWYEHGFFFAICHAKAFTPRMEALYILNYYTKYLEWVDTLFLVIKKKPLAFLHVYHHAATALLCYSQLLGRTSTSWLVITLNLFVHVVMYAYYALTSLKIRCPWKKAVTSLQITQFIIDLGVVYFASYTHWVEKYAVPLLPVMGACAAEKEHAVVSGVAILSSYLVLFVIFYKKTYSKKSASARSVRSGPRSPIREKDASEVLSNTGTRVVKAAAAASGNGLLTVQGDLKERPTTPQLESGRKD